MQLLNWAHTYFTEGGPKEGQARGLLRTSRPPLYLQHQGHSRTVIGLLENAQGNKEGDQGGAVMAISCSDSIPRT